MWIEKGKKILLHYRKKGKEKWNHDGDLCVKQPKWRNKNVRRKMWRDKIKWMKENFIKLKSNNRHQKFDYGIKNRISKTKINISIYYKVDFTYTNWGECRFE